jgi:hypothetical protein
MKASDADDVLRVTAMDSALALTAAARAYNWDDGFSVPRAIADHPLCDLAVALELFWLADAVEVLLGRHGASKDADWISFCQTLTARLLEGHYRPGSASFVPEFSRVELYQFRQQGVPEILLSAVEGRAQDATGS